MTVKAFLHLGGNRQAPEHSEYEVKMKRSGVREIVAVSNAKLFNESFLQVIDENKPVFIIISGIERQKIWMFNSHVRYPAGNNRTVDATPVLSSNLGVMLTQKETEFLETYISIRVGDEEYCAGDISVLSGPANLISLEDLVEFVSGEITWDNLRGRSFLYERKMAKESSRQEKIEELIQALQQEEKRSYELGFENRFLRLENIFLESGIQSLRDEVKDLEAKLEKIPVFIRKTFFFFNRLANRNRS